MYLAIHGFDSDISPYITFSGISAIAIYYLTKKHIVRNLIIQERPDAVVDGTDIERQMVIIVLLLPLILCVIMLMVIGFTDIGLAKIGWMIIAISVNIGQNLEAILRLSQPQ